MRSSRSRHKQSRRDALWGRQRIEEWDERVTEEQHDGQRAAVCDDNKGAEKCERCRQHRAHVRHVKVPTC